jgi:hypothetical protein
VAAPLAKVTTRFGVHASPFVGDRGMLQGQHSDALAPHGCPSRP